jgi:hypothetical protein
MQSFAVQVLFWFADKHKRDVIMVELMNHVGIAQAPEATKRFRVQQRSALVQT